MNQSQQPPCTSYCIKLFAVVTPLLFSSWEWLWLCVRLLCLQTSLTLLVCGKQMSLAPLLFMCKHRNSQLLDVSYSA